MSKTTSQRLGMLVGLILVALPFALEPLLPHAHSGPHEDWQCLACQVGAFLVATILCAVLLVGSQDNERHDSHRRDGMRSFPILLCKGPRGPPLPRI